MKGLVSHISQVLYLRHPKALFEEVEGGRDILVPHRMIPFPRREDFQWQLKYFQRNPTLPKEGGACKGLTAADCTGAWRAGTLSKERYEECCPKPPKEGGCNGISAAHCKGVGNTSRDYFEGVIRHRLTDTYQLLERHLGGCCARCVRCVHCVCAHVGEWVSG